jgi:hypothetical protein
MAKPRPLSFLDLLLLLVVLGAAAGARVWYLLVYVPSTDAKATAVLQVQGRTEVAKDQTETERLLASMKEGGVVEGYKGQPPLADQAELTAHVAPGFPIFRWLVEQQVADNIGMNPTTLLRWTHVGLGSLTATLYFLISRRVFHSTFVGLLAGLATALHPYWIINMAELEDGTLCTFLLAVTLWLGVRGGQQGGAFTSLLFGIFLSALALTRAGMLPFAFAGLLWFLWRCRYLGQGWLCAIVAFLGFSIGISSWTVRNFQTFGEPMPIVSTSWLHVWVGNNPQATGGPQTAEMEKTLKAERLDKLRKEEPFKSNQMKRYGELRTEALEEIQTKPLATLTRRLQALKFFLTGSDHPTPDGLMRYEDAHAALADKPEEQKKLLEFAADLMDCLAWTLLGMLVLAFLGWRWSFGWKASSLLAVAILWIPLPYLLGHAETGHGLRLPLDGPLLCLAAFAVVCLLPGIGMQFIKGEPRGSVEAVSA